MKRTSLLFFTLILLISCSKNFDAYENLVDPRISEKAPQKMLVYEAQGDPNQTVGEAFGALISTFYKLKRQHKMDFSAPVARWPIGPDTPQSEWVGIYAVPVSDSVEEIPPKALEEHPRLRLETWDYGLVAEILHKGSYASEKPTVDRLHAFIEDQGYMISGLHEEEYLKGPGMFGKGNPDKYYTIIRYVVSPKPKIPIQEDTQSDSTTISTSE